MIMMKRNIILDKGEYQNKSHSPHNNNNAITLMLTFMCNKSHSKLASADVDGKTKTHFRYSCITTVACLPTQASIRGSNRVIFLLNKREREQTAIEVFVIQ